MTNVVALAGARALPWLICCNLRAERLDPSSPRFCPGARAMLLRLSDILAGARRWNWRVIHIVDSPTGRRQGPIDALAPLPCEPVFERARGSAFSIPDFRAAVARAERAPIFVIGFALEDLALPTIFVGRDEGVDLVLVEDAVASRLDFAEDEALRLVTRTIVPTIAAHALPWLNAEMCRND